MAKVVHNFKYVGNINLREKSKNEKLALQYLNQGYQLMIKIKGATPDNQH